MMSSSDNAEHNTKSDFFSSRRFNVFIYGCENRRHSEKYLREQIFPLMLHKNTAEKFSFDDCECCCCITRFAAPSVNLQLSCRSLPDPAPEGIHRSGGLLEHGHCMQLHHGGDH